MPDKDFLDIRVQAFHAAFTLSICYSWSMSVFPFFYLRILIIYREGGNEEELQTFPFSANPAMNRVLHKGKAYSIFIHCVWHMVKELFTVFKI